LYGPDTTLNFSFCIMETKICTKCKKIQPLNEFNKNRAREDGLSIHCKSCVKENTSLYYIKNRDKILSYSKTYKEENDRTEYHKQWYKDNKDDLKQKEKIYRKNKYDTDPLFRLKTTSGIQIRNSINNLGFERKSKTIDVLNCSITFYKEYIESQFLEWMNWENYGKYNGEFNYGWDIDHIIPMSSAKNEEELLKLLKYNNTQPLCSKINREIKKNKIEWQNLLD